ncbi:MAG: hypothetical protein KDD66_00265 [Bdellovibrionales bacterium]|nr:hypothetical protein [Bdellovibrionales bacterium]
MPVPHLRFFVCLLLFTCLSGASAAQAQGRSWEMMDELDMAEEQHNPTIRPEQEPAEMIDAAPAEQPGESKRSVAVAHGMRKRDVQRQFGDPDSKKRDQQASIERWYYGDSSIIFNDGVVSAWVDNGDLSVRSLVPKRKRRAFERDEEFALEGWKKIWKKEDNVKVDTREDVLNDLVSESDEEK